MGDMSSKAIVALPIAVIAAIVAPFLLAWHEKSQLRKEFTVALASYDKICYGGEGKNGTLLSEKSARDLPESELPTIRGGVFIMRPSHDVDRGGITPEHEPARIDASFYELDESVRATSVSTIQTVVLVYPSLTSVNYASNYGGRTTTTMNQKIATLRIYDLEDKALIGTWHLQGKAPPGGFDQYNRRDVPGPDIAEFLEALPRR